jgi:outer membrane protein, heavy metal efflux system
MARSSKQLPFVTLLAMAWAFVAPMAQAGVLNLGEALALALEKSPELAAFSWDVRAAEARKLQAGLRPNPELTVEVEGIRWRRGPERINNSASLGLGLQQGSGFELPVGGGSITVPTFEGTRSYDIGRNVESGAAPGFREAEFTITLEQLLELGGKRIKRRRLAERDVDVASWDYEIARADVLSQVAKAFADVLAAQEQQGLRAELLEAAQAVEDATAARVTAGKIAPLELNRVRVDRAAAGIEARRAVHALEAARIRLAATWGESAPSFDRVAGRLGTCPPLASIESLQEQVASLPDTARWAAEVEKREAAVRLEKAGRIPNVTLAVGFRSEGQGEREVRGFGLSGDGIAFSRNRSRSSRDRDNTLLVEASLPLPIFDRNQGNIREAQCLLSKSQEERRAADVRIRSNLAATYQTAQAAHGELTTLETDVLPDAQETFELTQRGFRQGKFDYLHVLDAQRTLIDVRVRLVNAKAEFHHSVIDIERLSGATTQPGGAHHSGAEEK